MHREFDRRVLEPRGREHLQGVRDDLRLAREIDDPQMLAACPLVRAQADLLAGAGGETSIRFIRHARPQDSGDGRAGSILGVLKFRDVILPG